MTACLLAPDRHSDRIMSVVESITRERLLAVHSERFAPSELSAAIVGDKERAFG